MRVLILLAVVAAALAAPGKQSQRIVGGADTTIEQWPFYANINYITWGIRFLYCGGSIISNDIILTAAHCVDGERPSSFGVRLGSSLANSGGQFINIAAIKMHETYDTPVLDNDIALMKLATPIQESSTIGIARLPSARFSLPDNTPVTAIGVGALYSGGPAPTVLQSVEVFTVNQELCVERYAYLKTQPGYGAWPDVTDNMLCAGILDVGGKDACQGDSGGPLALSGNIVVGVTSWGMGCAHEFYPGVNARVSKYIDWIQNSSL
ncbi:unnamed protein product [Plutella xylostella]|uniref:(diamondback moth) hypothetical protein n=1 Tax=Plutella xylostella TaxID=51655 RepID=S5PZA0_PLUXY|nr:trypsin, alkaline C-like precursor [Plutella xylostella]AGR92347.1 serine protease [Plutella xylostella]CAG9134371.1 unnamed protein product [Plutella xylostella]